LPAVAGICGCLRLSFERFLLKDVFRTNSGSTTPRAPNRITELNSSNYEDHKNRMPDPKLIPEPTTPPPTPFIDRILDFAQRMWRPAGTVVVIGLALLLTWHVVNGKNGLTVWQKKRVEDRQLRRDIDDLEKDNARLRERIDRLRNDPDAIEHEAREKLHYARPGEVIVAIPPASPSDSATPAK
jgi:cell division protein FtsB